MSLIAPTVLVVEDDPSLLEALVAALGGAGYRVVTAADAAHALLTLAGTTPCVAFVDLMLPEGSGFQILQAIKERFNLKVPVVMMSAFGSDAHRNYAHALGAEAFLVKPFPLSAFVALAVELCPPGPQPTGGQSV